MNIGARIAELFGKSAGTQTVTRVETAAADQVVEKPVAMTVDKNLVANASMTESGRKMVALMDQAQTAFDLGNHASAADLLQKATGFTSNSTEDFYLANRSLEMAKRLDQSVPEWNKTVGLQDNVGKYVQPFQTSLANAPAHVQADAEGLARLKQALELRTQFRGLTLDYKASDLANNAYRPLGDQLLASSNPDTLSSFARVMSQDAQLQDAMGNDITAQESRAQAQQAFEKIGNQIVNS